MTDDLILSPVEPRENTLNPYVDAVSFSEAVRNLVVWSSAQKAGEPPPWVYVSRKHFGAPYAFTVNSIGQFDIATPNANGGWKTVPFISMLPHDAMASCYMVDRATAIGLLAGQLVLM